MDVKSALLNGPISELLYVEQPPGFEDPKFPNHVNKIHKDFLLRKGFEISKADPTLFTRKVDKDKFVCQIYVDDIIFGSTNQTWCEEFSRIMTKRFGMSMMGKLTFFLGFQIKQLKDETFISQTKYTKDMLKKFNMEDAKPIKTPMSTQGHLDLNEDGKAVD